MSEFTTSNLPFATVMIAYGSKLVKTDKSDRKRVLFELDHPPVKVMMLGQWGEMEELVSGTFDYLFNQFSTGKMFLHPNSFNTMRDLKSIIYA